MHYESVWGSFLKLVTIKTKKLNKSSSFDIYSPLGTAGIRGTEFQMALSGADRVYFGAVYRADRMRPEERLDTARMANALGEAKAFADNQSLLETLKMCVSDEAHGLIVFLTNGSFDGLPSSLAASCSNVR